MPAVVPVLFELPSNVYQMVGAGLNVAVTDTAPFTGTIQVLVPLQPPPDQPANIDPLEGVAVRVTWMPEVKLASQVAPQLIPVGLEVTVPVPLPVFVTVRV
jgi:hypothetical protein